MTSNYMNQFNDIYAALDLKELKINQHRNIKPYDALGAILVADINGLMQDWGISTVLAMELITHLPLVPHVCVSELGQHWFR